MSDRSLEVRVALLEQLGEDLGKLVSDHEGRMRRLERIVMYGMGVVGLGSFLLNLYEHLGRLTTR